MRKAQSYLPFILAMCAVVAASNYLVQFPVQATLGGINLADLLTWGAFTYPVAFLVTDLTNRRFDPAAAREAGFDNVFLHGLCTFGFAARALVNGVGNGDPEMLRSISCRFAKPVMLGAGLRTEIWLDGTEVRFRTSQGSAVALSSGTATLRG